MKKLKFEQLKSALLDRRYKIYVQQWHHEDYVIGKSFHKDDNKWEEDRAAYQILISVYDWTDESKEMWSRLPDDMRKKVGLEVHVDMSRTIDERIDLVFPFHEDDTIEEMERIAEGWFLAMCLLIPKPREEKPEYEQRKKYNPIP